MNRDNNESTQTEKGLVLHEELKSKIKNFEDLELYFLKGAGLSSNTYKCYLQAVKQFYEFTKGLHPLQVQPRNIESFYDHLIKNGTSRKTASLRMSGLKRFFKGVCKVAPFFISPFDTMEPKLKEKISRPGKKKGVKEVLSKDEIDAFLQFLEDQNTDIAEQTRGIVLMIFTSGLRASELLQLTFGAIEESKGKYKVSFSGKGDSSSEFSKQALVKFAVDTCESIYIQTHPKPRPSGNEPFFWTVPTRPGEEIHPLQYHSLYMRIRKFGAAAVKAGVIKPRAGLEFSPHLFRRSGATYLNEIGAPLADIKHWLRHASINTTINHYIKPGDKGREIMEEAYKKTG